MAQNKARFQFEQGLTHFHQEEYSQASIYFEEAVLEDPEYSEALYNLSCCYSMTGQRDKALMYLSRATKLNPHCQDWANEDREFNGLREDPVFKRILSGDQEPEESPVEPAAENPAPSGADRPSDDFEELKFETVEPPLTPSPPAEESPIPPDDPPPNLTDKKQPKFKPVTSPYPPCLRCEGIVLSEKQSTVDPKISIGVIYAGIAITCGLFFSLVGIIGVPVIASGLYLFARMDEVWVCQNCGARGSECGQPAPLKNPTVDSVLDEKGGS